MADALCPNCRSSNPSDALFCSSCGNSLSQSDSDALIGQTIGGRYLLQGRLGQGSAGTLYRAEHVTLRRRIAVKLLHKHLVLSDDAVERFRREAITVCEIDNDHIPQVHDFGRSDDGRLFFAMEFLDGESLAALLAREGKLSPERTADILAQVADGLMEAHTLGYVHRDLRPRSIFLTRRRGRQDFVKILDFGLAKLVQPEVDAQRTAMGMTYGDARYMAPEQARGESTDRRADIYSLGALGFEMLTGEPPFVGGSAIELLTKVLDAPVPRIRDRRPECPPWLESVIRTALAKKAADRLQTVAQLLDVLERKQVLANQPPLPMAITMPSSSKLAGMQQLPAASPAARPGPPQGEVRVFVSSPSLKMPASSAAPASNNATQAWPTVAPAAKAPQPAAPAAPERPRETLSYPAVRPVRSAAPGSAPEAAKPAAAATAATPAKATAPDKSGELRLLAERVPVAAATPAPAAAKTAPAAKPAPAPEPAKSQPAVRIQQPAVPTPTSVFIAPSLTSRGDPTPRTARVLMQQEVMAWEEAASPVLPPMQEDLTESARMTEPTGGHASADTPVEAMNFEQPAAAEAKPSVAARPITSAAIADMRSIAPSSVARGGQGDKAAVAQAAASAPSAQSPAPAPVSQRTPLPSEIVRSPSKPTYTAPQSSPGMAASASVPSPAKDRPSSPGGADVRPSVSFDPGAGLPSALSPSQEADEDATIPQIKLSPTEHPAAASSTAAASAGSPTPPDEVDTNLLPKISAPQPAVAAPASPTPAADAAPQIEARGEEEASGKTPVESSWFATPAAGASEGFAADDDDVSIRRKGLPKWAIPAAAAGLLVLGLGWFAMRSPTPGPASTPPTTESTGAASGTPPTAPPVTAPATPTATAEPVVPKEPAPAATGTAATGAEAGKPAAPTATPAPQPVATALPGTEKPAPAAAPPTVVATNVPKPTVEAMAPVAPKPAEPKPAVEKPVEAPPVKAVAEAASATQKPTRADKKAGKVAKTEEDPVATAEPKAATEPKAAGGKNGEAGALISSGRKKLDDGDPDAAVALFAKAAELDPKNVDAVGGLGEASFEAGNLAAAAKHLGKAARLAPRRTSYLELLAQTQLKLGRFSDAVETCNKVLKQNPGSSKAKQTLEVAQKKLGDG